jgi:nucleoside-diphosphate-sugar epimerase
MTKTLLSIGHGYSAQGLADRLLPQGWRIIGTTRSPEKSNVLRAAGIEPLVWPGKDLGPAISEASHILTSVAPVDGLDPVLAHVRDEIAANATRLDWVGYLSTTAVYGNLGGGWVTEDSPLTPATERGKARVAAEAEWSAIPGLPLHIFRLAGIYGPGRGPFAKVRNGTARRIIKQGQVFSRTHVEDIARVLEASINRPSPGAAYNVCDDDPAPPEDVIAYAAELLGVPVPPAASMQSRRRSATSASSKSLAFA